MVRNIDPREVRALRRKFEQDAKSKTPEQKKGTEIFYKMAKHLGPDGYVAEMKRRKDNELASDARKRDNTLDALTKEAIFEMNTGLRFSDLGGENIFARKEQAPTAKAVYIAGPDGLVLKDQRIY